MNPYPLEDDEFANDAAEIAVKDSPPASTKVTDQVIQKAVDGSNDDLAKSSSNKLKFKDRMMAIFSNPNPNLAALSSNTRSFSLVPMVAGYRSEPSSPKKNITLSDSDIRAGTDKLAPEEASTLQDMHPQGKQLVSEEHAKHGSPTSPFDVTDRPSISERGAVSVASLRNKDTITNLIVPSKRQTRKSAFELNKSSSRRMTEEGSTILNEKSRSRSRTRQSEDFNSGMRGPLGDQMVPSGPPSATGEDSKTLLRWLKFESNPSSKTLTLSGISKRLKGGFYNRYSNSSSTDDVNEDTSTFDCDDLNEDDDERSVGSRTFALMPVKVFLGFSRESILIRIPVKCSFGELVRAILTEISSNVPKGKDFVNASMDESNWRIAKIDRNQLLSRIWLSDEILTKIKIIDGDELRLISYICTNTLHYCLPTSSKTHVLTYSFDDTVSETVNTLINIHTLPNTYKYGLFYKKLGIWLDEKLNIANYEINTNDLLDFRAKSQEFLIRIHLPNSDTKFALKVIPSFLVSDVIAMVKSNIVNRKIEMKSFLKEGEMEYSFEEVQSSVWMVDNKVLAEYNLHNSSQDIQFRIQYLPIVIELDCYEKSGHCNRVQMFTSETTTVLDLLKSLNLENNFYEEDIVLGSADEAIANSTENAFGLFTKGHERLKADQIVWSCLDDSLPFEIFEYRLIGRKYSISLIPDENVRISMELNQHKHLSLLYPAILRRLGLAHICFVEAIFVAHSRDRLDSSKSLMESRIREGSTLMVKLSPSKNGQEFFERSVWSEPEDCTDNVLFAAEQPSTVLAASLNKLIEKLTSGSSTESLEYLDFMKTFLLTYQSFTTPGILFEKLLERYYVPWMRYQGVPFDVFDKTRLKVQLRVCNVMQQWLKKYPADFISHEPFTLDERKKSLITANKLVLRAHFLHFVESVLSSDHPNLARQIRKNVLRLNEGEYSGSKSYGQYTGNMSPLSKVTTNTFSMNEHSKPSLFAYDSENIARQLTLIDLALFKRIMPYEFLNQGWTKADAETRAPNIIAITRRFNETAFWVVKSILEVKTVRARAKRITKLTEICGHLLELNNFSSLMAFIAGFNKSSITRLKHTIKELSGRTMKKLAEVEKLMSAESSFKAYRSRIHSVNPPCIPYLGVYLLDLTYIEDGNPNRIGHLINFAKRRLINALIREVQQYQDQSYSFDDMEELIGKINQSLTMPFSVHFVPNDTKPRMTMKEFEDYLFELSNQREPRGVERSSVE